MNNIVLVTALMFLFFLVGLVFGFNIAYVLGAAAVIFAASLWGVHSLSAIYLVVSRWSINFIITSVPLYVFMALVLEKSGIANALYDAMYKWMGRFNGGLAIGTVAICTLFAAMCVSITLAAMTMSIIAVPNMIKRGYDKDLVVGSVMAGSALGPLIPPSIMMIIYCLFTNDVGVGEMFMGGVLPGLLLSGLFMIYIAVRCFLKPSSGPGVPPGEAYTWKEKILSLKSVILPVIIVIMVLGSIFLGIATPTEAASVGVLGAVVSAGVNRRLSWSMIYQSCLTTISISVTVMWIVFGAACFAMVYQSLGAPKFIAEMVSVIGLNSWMFLLIVQITWFILGCLLDGVAILMITLPVFLPLASSFGFDPLWFGILFMVNTEMSYLTPPFGYCIFSLRAAIPSELVSTRDIYRAVWPFVALQALGLLLVILFPKIVLLLPRMMFTAGR
jgi:tripartite ATP-independent transporter DctM subunit